MSNLFQDDAYYGISSKSLPSPYLLGDSLYTEPPSPLSVTNTSYSSNNWQVFFQDPIYFIRNYDHKEQYQLAVPNITDPQPQLLPSTGDLNQQWNITLWPDGTKRLTNMLVGVNQILSVQSDHSGERMIPVLNSNVADVGGHWTFFINTSAGKVNDAMLVPFSSVESTSTSSTITPTSSSTPISSPTASGTPLAATASGTLGGSKGLSGGAIAGIVVGAIVLLALIIGVVVVVMRKRRKGAARATPSELPNKEQTSQPSGSNGPGRGTHYYGGEMPANGTNNRKSVDSTQRTPAELG